MIKTTAISQWNWLRRANMEITKRVLLMRLVPKTSRLTGRQLASELIKSILL